VTLDEGVYDLDPKHASAKYLRENLDDLVECGAVKMVEEESEPEPVIEAAVVETPEQAATTGRKRGRRQRKRKT